MKVECFSGRQVTKGCGAWALAFMACLTLWIGSAGVAQAGEQPASPAMELAVKFFSGPNESSGSAGNLQGSMGYLLNFRAENRKGIFRLNAAAQFEFASGSAPVSDPTASDAYTMYGAAFLPGFFLYPFTEGRVRPFLGGAGIVGWYLMNLSDAYTQGLSFGYEAQAGVDLQFGGAAGKIWRIRSAFTNHTASVGGNTSGVSLSAFQLGIGIAY